MNGSWLKVLDLLGVTLPASLNVRPCQHVEASLTSSSHSCRSDTCWNWIVQKIKRMCRFHLDLHLSVLPWFPVLETPKKSIALRMLSYLAAHWLHWLSGKCPLSAAWNSVVQACCSTFSFLLRIDFDLLNIIFGSCPSIEHLEIFCFLIKIFLLSPHLVRASCRCTGIFARLLGRLQIAYETHDLWWRH